MIDKIFNEDCFMNEFEEFDADIDYLRRSDEVWEKYLERHRNLKCYHQKVPKCRLKQLRKWVWKEAFNEIKKLEW